MLPNLVLVVLDTARATALEPYGAPRGATPTVAAMADMGASWSHVYATSNWTLPSHASLLSGRLPRSLGLGAGGHPAAVMGEHADALLPAVLGRAGFDTAAFSANPWISPRNGFHHGFDTFVEVRGRRHAPGDSLLERLRWSRDALLARVDDGLNQIDAAIQKRFDGGSKRPFFWFVNLMECHSPYLPPRPCNDLGARMRLRAAAEARRHLSHRSILEASLGRIEVPPATLARMRHLYGRAVRAMDDWLDRLFDRLKARGLFDDTIVVVTSDHGENLGEAGLLGHVLTVDDRLLRVPLVMCGPGVERLGQGSISTDDHPRSLADVPALLAGALGLDDHPWQTAPCPDGVAVAQVDGFRTLGSDAPAIFERAFDISGDLLEHMNAALSCATDGRWKLVRRNGETQLFDVATDRWELVDRQADEPEIAAHLAALLDTVDDHALMAQETAASPTTAAARPSEGGDPEELEELEERLRLLGYM